MQRRLLPLLPPEFGEYMLAAQRGFEATADVAVVGPALKVLDADLAFEVGSSRVEGWSGAGKHAPLPLPLLSSPIGLLRASPRLFVSFCLS